MAHFLLLSASFGSGHNTAAQQIKITLEEENHSVLVIDLQDFFGAKQNTFFQYLYAFSEKIPFIWKILAAIADTPLYSWTIKNLYIRSKDIWQFHAYIQEEKPDFVLATFPTWSGILARYKEKYTQNFASGLIITDAGSVGWEWYMWKNAIDAYFVIDTQTKQHFVSKFQHIKDNVFVSFFPLHGSYFLDKCELKKEKIVVVCTGLNYEFLSVFLQEMQTKTTSIAIEVVEGRNRRVFELLKAQFQNSSIIFHSFLDIKDALKDIDILVAKPGGAIVCECIAQDVVMAIPSYFPGQEYGNLQMVCQNNVGFFETNPLSMAQKIEVLDIKKMLPNFALLKRKNSAQYIIDKIQSL